MLHSIPIRLQKRITSTLKQCKLLKLKFSKQWEKIILKNSNVIFGGNLNFGIAPGAEGEDSDAEGGTWF